ncbi:M20/M25/M40 family metallo-hydrolase [Patescibacteria group bacterium]|nr:MAG: M20/M25/M40 family metallo-hydrolase [Patescibacteria group bacterium]
MFKTYAKLLKEFVALKSISTDERFLPEMDKTVKWLKDLFEQNGFTVTLLTDKECSPVVVARYDAGKPRTTLVYGHYDVQPAEVSQGWNGDPFDLREDKGRLIGRGSVDNKGQILAHMVAVFERIKDGSLDANTIFLIEGNEETTNPCLDRMIEQNKELLACDELLVSDGDMTNNRPTLEATLRGGYNLRVKVRTARTDMHSGLVGGAVPNAAKVLADALASLTDQRGRVLVDGFYDGMVEPTEAIRLANAKIAKTMNADQHFGVKQLVTANEVDFYTQTGLYPTLQISGINSGYTGVGYANIVPATAEGRVNVRTVVGQDVLKNAQAVKSHLLAALPDYTVATIDWTGEHGAVELNLKTEAAQRSRGLLAETYGGEVVTSYVGGAIPIVADFQRLLGVDPLLVPFANDDCNMHGANENFRIDLARKSLEFSYSWFGAPAE